MNAREEYIAALVEDTIDGYELFLSSDAMTQLRGALSDIFHGHPVVAAMIDENLPRGVVLESEEQLVDPQLIIDALKRAKNA